MLVKLLTFAIVVNVVMSSEKTGNFGQSTEKNACPQDLQKSSHFETEVATGFSTEHLKIDLNAIDTDIKNEKNFINELQKYTLEPPSPALCEYIRSNTSVYNGKIMYIAGLCNVDISVRKQQFFALASAKRHVNKAEEKFAKYFLVLKSQIKLTNGFSAKTKKPQNKEEPLFKDISHPLMTTEIDDNDVMSQELQRLWNSGESIMEAVKDENILQLTNILLKEIVHGFELIFSPNINPSNENPEISYVMSSSSMNTYITEISNNASLLNIYVTDLLPLMDLSRTDLDEDIMSPNNLQCIVDHKNMKLESHGYKIGTSSIDYYKPKQIGMIRSLSNDGKQLILTLVFKIIKKNMPLIPVELIDVAESSTYEYLNEGGQYGFIFLIILAVVIIAYKLRKVCKRLDNNEFVEKQVASLNGNKKKSKGTPSAPLLPL